MFRNLRHARIVYHNWNGRYGDPLLIDHFFNKAMKQWYNDTPSYNYWWVAYVAFGLAIGMCGRHLLFNPDVGIRRGDNRRNIVDRWQRHMYALPYFNHFLRNYSQMFVNSLVDNEADFALSHPWGIRPDRVCSYSRFPLILSSPKYFIDNHKLSYSTSHKGMNEYYESIGYVAKNSAKGEESEDEDDE